MRVLVTKVFGELEEYLSKKDLVLYLYQVRDNYSSEEIKDFISQFIAELNKPIDNDK